MSRAIEIEISDEACAALAENADALDDDSSLQGNISDATLAADFAQAFGDEGLQDDVAEEIAARADEQTDSAVCERIRQLIEEDTEGY